MSHESSPPTVTHAGIPGGESRSIDSAPSGAGSSALPSPAEGTRDLHAPTEGCPADSSPEGNVPLVTPPGYELQEEIGSGGMGVVYRARDIALNRHVALKFLHPRYPTSGVAARRFLDEAAITGQLQHPGIPPIHHIGSLSDSRPFLAMKLIKGSTLDDLLKRRANPAEERGRFLAVFEQVCQAVGYAHSRDVIHRDLKPANVMVGNFAEVQVMDWGLAKTLTADRSAAESESQPEATMGTEIRSLRDLDSATQVGSILGTPAYMPPEQAGGEIEKIDSRSDVFGLGAILSVILTGNPPYTGKDSESIRLKAIRGNLVDGFARLDSCGAELELIALCKRCLAAEPADRPADAGEVAAAVAAFRTQAEERARQAELERARAEVAAAEQVKRRKVQAALGVAFTALVAMGGVFAWWAQHQIDAENRRVAEQAIIDAARKDAEAREKAEVERRVTRTLDQTYRYIDAGRWQDARNNWARASDLLAGRKDPSLQDSIDQAARDLEMGSLTERAAEEWAVIGPVRGIIDYSPIAAVYSEAFDRYGLDVLHGPVGDVAARIRETKIATALIAALDDWSRFDPDPERRARLQEVADRADDNDWRARLRRYWAEGNVPALNDLAQDPAALDNQKPSIILLASLIRGTPRVELLRRAQRLYPTDYTFNKLLGDALTGNATRASVEGVGFLRTAAAARPQSPTAFAGLGRALRHARDFDGALAAFKQATQLVPDYAMAHAEIFAILRDQKKPKEAEQSFKDGLQVSQDPVRYYLQCGRTLYNRGNYPDAVELFRKAVAIWPNDPLFWRWLGWAERESKDRDSAIEAFREAVRLQPGNPANHDCLGFTLWLEKDYPAARKELEEAVRVGPNHASSRNSLGLLLRDMGYPGAIAAFKEAMKLDPNNATYCANLASVYFRAKNFEDAADCYRKAILINPRQPFVHNNLGRSLELLGDLDGAIEAFTEAERLKPDLKGVRQAITRVSKARISRNIEQGRIAPPPHEPRRP